MDHLKEWYNTSVQGDILTATIRQILKTIYLKIHFFPDSFQKELLDSWFRYIGRNELLQPTAWVALLGDILKTDRF